MEKTSLEIANDIVESEFKFMGDQEKTASTVKGMYDAYINAGFNDQQAVHFTSLSARRYL